VDCLINYLNPFVPLSVEEPTKAGFRQKPIKVASKEFIDGSKLPKSAMEKIAQRRFDLVTDDEMKPLSETMAKEIDRQRKRIGGNFVIAYAIATQEQRNHIREILPECNFITLTLSKETQKKRLLARHDEMAEAEIIKILTTLHALFELPGENERNTYNVDITDDMSRDDDVVEKVKQILEDI